MFLCLLCTAGHHAAAGCPLGRQKSSLRDGSRGTLCCFVLVFPTLLHSLPRHSTQTGRLLPYPPHRECLLCAFDLAQLSREGGDECVSHRQAQPAVGHADSDRVNKGMLAPGRLGVGRPGMRGPLCQDVEGLRGIAHRVKGRPGRLVLPLSAQRIQLG